MDQLPPSNPTPPTPSTPNSSNVDQAHFRLGFLIIGVLLFAVLVRKCGNQTPKINEKPGETTKIKNIPHTIKVIKKVLSPDNNDNKNIYVPPEGSITITPKDKSKSIDQLVSIHYQEIGFVFEPGLEFSCNLYCSYGVDAKLSYFYRLGFGAGIVTGSNITLPATFDVFFSYRLDQIHLHNTEVMAAYTPAFSKIPFTVGLRINL